MPKYTDLTGHVFGKLTVISLDPAKKDYPQKYLCTCECGKTTSILAFSLTSGKTKNCVTCGRKKCQKVPDDVLLESYGRIKNVWLVGKEVGLCGQSVHQRLIKLGVQEKMNYFTDDDKFFLLEHYKNYLLDGKLQELADKMNRTKSFICRQAKKLGFTDLKRKKKLLANFTPSIKPGHWKDKTHPKGFLGKKFSPESKDKIGKASVRSQAKINSNPDKRAAISNKMMKTKQEKGNYVLPRHKTTWKGGWREIGGKRKYFRSRWEANYARYLEYLKTTAQIKEWDHEAEVFWFKGIKRGCMSFLPDFRVTDLNGAISFHEVKGWMDDRSKTKIRRMAIYHPTVLLKIIDAKWFKENNKHLTLTIYGWET